jgi:hypothetical protein
MKEETISSMFEKYENGETSLEEEQALFSKTHENESEVNALAGFLKRNQIKTPDHFNKDLWKSFDKKTSKNSRFRIGVFSAAASILLLFSMYFWNISKKEMTYNEKVALLNEAKSMFENISQKELDQNIILETDMVIVYTSNK